jgi:hypothetical protein
MTRGFNLPARSGRRQREARGASVARRLLVVAFLLANLVALSVAPVAAATLVIVTPNTPNGWQTRVTSDPATTQPTATFVNGPEHPPQVSGALPWPSVTMATTRPRSGTRGLRAYF